MNNIKISIINLESRADRRSAVLADLRNIGQIKVSEDNLFKAILNEGNGALGCAISHFTILSQFISEIQYEYLVVFEDDFMPRKSIDPGDILLKLKGLVSLDIFLFSHKSLTCSLLISTLILYDNGTSCFILSIISS